MPQTQRQPPAANRRRPSNPLSQPPRSRRTPASPALSRARPAATHCDGPIMPTPGLRSRRAPGASHLQRVLADSSASSLNRRPSPANAHAASADSELEPSTDHAVVFAVSLASPSEGPETTPSASGELSPMAPACPPNHLLQSPRAPASQLQPGAGAVFDHRCKSTVPTPGSRGPRKHQRRWLPRIVTPVARVAGRPRPAGRPGLWYIRCCEPPPISPRIRMG